MYELRNHPHIVSLKEFCQDAQYYYIVEELAEGGELFDAIIHRESYSEREAQNLVRTLLYTLRYCHERGVVHRDLKPENILLSAPNDYLNIKIADFGFATHVSHGGLFQVDNRNSGVTNNLWYPWVFCSRNYSWRALWTCCRYVELGGDHVHFVRGG